MSTTAFYAHSDPRNPVKPPSVPGVQWQPLREHLIGVAKLAKHLGQGVRPNDDTFLQTAYLAGLLHDLGKYRDEFQQYLRRQRGSSADTAHAVYGAAAACYRFNSETLSFVIAGHHSGLHDESDLVRLIDGSKFRTNERLPEIINRAEKELGQFSPLERVPFDDSDAGKRQYEFLTRFLFSLLIDADRLDTERWEKEQILRMPWRRPTIQFDAETLLQRLEAVRDERARSHPSDELNTLRNMVFDTCLQRGGDSPQGFFSLTVPTGGGKTLSSMAFALSHARQHNLRRVIVVIPYLSIIEQNASEYRDIFGEEQVLEHHSAVELSGKSKSVAQEANAEPPQASDAEKAMENWDVSVIVTTSVQFIETLFAASPGQTRKLHNIARSVVVFDEVQTLPTHLLEPLLDVLRELKDHYGVSFLFCSATQPAFRKSPNLKRGFELGEMIEIAPDPIGTYRKLQRVSYQVVSAEDRWDWWELAERLLSQPQALCVLNLRKQAFEAWQTMRALLKEQACTGDAETGLFHLSSAMCPAHRLDLLGLSKAPPSNNVKARLKSGLPCWVVSTQLIEAGVDIDFPVVFRAMGPLDSIVQSAGRCNREGLLRDEAGNPRHGQVVVFHPQVAGLPPGIYERATGIASIYLDSEKFAVNPKIFADYFSELYQTSPTDHAKRGEHTIQEDRAEFNFRRVAERAKVIKDNTVAAIAPYGQATEMVEKICKTRHFDRYALRKLQRYMINLRPFDFQKLQQIGALQPLLPEQLEIFLLDKFCYQEHLGVVIENRSPEDLIV